MNKIDNKVESFYRTITLDLHANEGNVKGTVIVILYRLAFFSWYFFQNHRILGSAILPYLIFYRIFVEWILAVEIPFNCNIGSGLIIDHGQGLVINKSARIGKNCRLRNSVTIGCKITKDGKQLPSPVIGDNVDIGAQSCIIGDISIGNNAVIGAGSVVVKSVPDNCVVAGNPAKVLYIREVTV